ncbi:hypothetical protein BJ508DRAFT_320184 [Ascobolus immersus RN42]|uniref:Uncharacterized protein n=1 Tax=Ascobolus immersus RN42 TaxID=1160509 RepID=A0A3N4IRM7_ASCIM|nr:hypothetical protein BJ508DRAFT_320184 [Ascobolus immersus RN42]
MDEKPPQESVQASGTAVSPARPTTLAAAASPSRSTNTSAQSVVTNEHIRTLENDTSGNYNGGYNGRHFTFPIPASLPSDIRDKMLAYDRERDLTKPPVKFGASMPRFLTEPEYKKLSSVEQGRYDLGIFPGTAKAKGKVTAFRSMMESKCRQQWGIEWNRYSCLAKYQPHERQCILYTTQTTMADALGWMPEKTRHQVEQGIVSRYRAHQAHLNLLSPKESETATAADSDMAQVESGLNSNASGTTDQPEAQPAAEEVVRDAGGETTPAPATATEPPVDAVKIKTEPGVLTIPEAMVAEKEIDVEESPRKKQKLKTTSPLRSPGRGNPSAPARPPIIPTLGKIGSDVRKVQVRYKEGSVKKMTVHTKLDRESMLYNLEEDVEPANDFMCRLENDAHKILKFTDKNFKRVVDKAISSGAVLHIFPVHEDSDEESSPEAELEDSIMTDADKAVGYSRDSSLSEATISRSDKEFECENGGADDTTLGTAGNGKSNPDRVDQDMGPVPIVEGEPGEVVMGSSEPSPASEKPVDNRLFMGKNFPVIQSAVQEDDKLPVKRSGKIKLMKAKSTSKPATATKAKGKAAATAAPTKRVTRKAASNAAAVPTVEAQVEEPPQEEPPKTTGKGNGVRTRPTKTARQQFEPPAAVESQTAATKKASIAAERKKNQQAKKATNKETEAARAKLLQEM